VTLADPGGLGDVAVAANGRAAAVWQEADASYGLSTPLSLAVGEPGAGGWSAPQAGPGIGQRPRVAINSRGDVLVGWVDVHEPLEYSEPVSGYAVVRPAGGDWGTIGALPGTGSLLWEPAPVALDEAGRGYAAWATFAAEGGASQTDGSVASGSAAGWPRSGRVGFNTGAQIVAGPGGTALALGGWYDHLTTQELLAAASYDGSPQVRLTAPARGRWDARTRQMRWTIHVRNAGRGRALGVTVSIRLVEGTTLVASRPTPRRRPGSRLTWRLGDIAPRAGRTLVLVLRQTPAPSPGSDVRIDALLSATQMAPRLVQSLARASPP
jgi:hypothetical protein